MSSQSWNDSQACSRRNIEEGMARSRSGQGQLAVEKGIVEGDAGRVGAGVAEPDAVDASPVNRGQTHRAGLAAGVDFTSLQTKNAERLAGGADGAHFGVGGGIVVARDAVDAFTDHDAVLRDDRSEGSALAAADVFSRQSDGFAHELRVRRKLHCGMGASPDQYGIRRSPSWRVTQFETRTRGIVITHRIESMKMRGWFRLFWLLLLGFWSASSFAKTVVFWQAGFPAVDSPAPDEAGLRAAFAGASFMDAAALGDALSKPETDLLVLPYGSAWPEAEWDSILRYLDRGGNLIVLGGKPFTRAAFEDASGWHVRTASVAQSLELFIHDYQETPGSDPGGSAELRFAANPDVFPQLPAFGWKRAFSPVVRLSVVDGDTTGGHTGYEDMDLTTLAWGERDGHKLAAPVLELDHNANRFVGGRWILVACEPDADFFSNSKLLAMLAEIALRRNDRFAFRPRLPLFLPGEALEFRFKPSDPMAEQPDGDQLRVRVTAEDGTVLYDQTAAFPGAHRLTLPASAEGGRGFHTVEATLIRDGKPLRIYRSGYWMRDWDYLLSGPKLTVGSDYFQLDGKPLPVVGTTYMSSDVSRMYLMLPNAYVWDHDMAQIRAAGLNMIRTGLWTAWKPELAANGQMSEDALRTVEAFPDVRAAQWAAGAVQSVRVLSG